MGFVNIASEIFDILTTVKNAGGSQLAEVFNYDVAGPSSDTGYPYACVSNLAAIEDPLDSANNKALYTFLVRVVDVAKDKTLTEARMRSLADTILVELRKRGNATFGGVADKVFPFKTTWKWETGDKVPARVLEIEINVQQSHSI